ncbi:DNA replication factor Cdt1 [Stegastes partitus]|uniref:DNA replication factor Cdt1 n=1 Tax=Stegastes partitus TaxID=144197 RepID=A0A9Y4N188_9TELE|nr:PREDICTED: DNA replication factor Cdt1 [Stegastes partitus]
MSGPADDNRTNRTRQRGPDVSAPPYWWTHRKRRGFLIWREDSSSCEDGTFPVFVDLYRARLREQPAIFLLCGFCSRSDMSQARVTDFFTHSKKGSRGPAKAPGPAANRHASRCPSSVREEFVRVIDEVVGLTDGQPAVSNTTKPSSPRTPKRTSADAQCAVEAASSEHSTAKKRRPTEAAGRTAASVCEKVRRKSARKKLVLPKETAQAALQPIPCEVTQQPLAPAIPIRGQTAGNQAKLQPNSSPQRSQDENPRRQTNKALCKEDIAAIKSRLQRIKKDAKEITSAASSALASTSSSFSSACLAPNDTAPPIHKAITPPTSDAELLKCTVAHAKELAAKAQRRRQERETQESKCTETQTQDSTEQPAYQRYNTLAQDALPGLSLPYHYRVLAEMFRSMDTVVSMLYNRRETASFSKIKRGVQDMMHKRFEESHVGQIKTVFPEAYTFRQEKNNAPFNNSIKKGSYQLVVEPVILSGQNEARHVLSASRLLERRKIFHLNLISIVKQHHKAFLSSLVLPVSIPEDRLTRWHPRFNVDTVPAVQTSPLPQVPHADRLVTAQEVLDKARSLITPKMEKALVSLAAKTEDKATESNEPAFQQKPAAPQISTPSTAPAAQVPVALKGVSQSLLDRIRAKEAQKLHAAMTRNPTQEERLLMMSRLGELARILRNVFVAEKKTALIMEVACNRMVASYRSTLSTGEMEKHIRLLAEVAADWLTVHPVRKDFYLKLNKNMELSIVLDKLSNRLREEERL